MPPYPRTLFTHYTYTYLSVMLASFAPTSIHFPLLLLAIPNRPPTLLCSLPTFSSSASQPPFSTFRLFAQSLCPLWLPLCFCFVFYFSTTFCRSTTRSLQFLTDTFIPVLQLRQSAICFNGSIFSSWPLAIFEFKSIFASYGTFFGTARSIAAFATCRDYSLKVM